MTRHCGEQVLTRIWVDSPIVVGQVIVATDSQSHYLRNVLRIKDRACVYLFNGIDGEWVANTVLTGRKGCTFEPVKLVRPQVTEKGPWLLFAPVKKYRLDFLIQKSVELGAELIWPVRTRRTVVRKIGKRRLLANAIEAAEQCGSLSVPRIGEFGGLSDVISNWTKNRTLFWGDETGGGVPALTAFSEKISEAAFLIGPEGGFEPCERKLLGDQSFTKAIDLGPRVLRSDTAGLMALALWQGTQGINEVK